MRPDVGNPFARAHALLIGVGRYQDPSIQGLRYVARDVAALRRVLCDPLHVGIPDDHVVALVDEQATEREVRKALRRLHERVLRDTEPERPLVVVFFAGHGGIDTDLKTRGAPPYLLIPHDAERATLTESAIRYSEVQEKIDALESDRVLLLLDACFSGNMTTGQVGSRDIAVFDVGDFASTIEKATLGTGRVTISSSTPAQRSFEVDALEQGLFTHCLVEGLTRGCKGDDQGLIRHDELFAYVREHVPRLAERHRCPNAQEPQMMVHAVGAPIAVGRIVARAAAGLVAKLVAVARGSRYVLPPKPSVSVGRQKPKPGQAGNDLVVRCEGDEQSKRISRQHLTIVRAGPGFLVTDLSRHGTSLNGRRLEANQPSPLAPGDELDLAGVIRLGFVLEPARAGQAMSSVPGASGVVLEASAGTCEAADGTLGDAPTAADPGDEPGSIGDEATVG